eukprot:g6852.t1
MTEESNLSYSVTSLTSLTHPRGGAILSLREGSNNQLDLFDSVLQAKELDLLVRGDILVLDNAKIHHAQETTPLLTLLFNLLGIEMRFLPTYSPEFNPCEIMFHMAKQHIKNNRDDDCFLVEIFRGFAAGCDRGKVIESYRKCIP